MIVKVNDNVRCVLNKNMFDKGSKPKWSTKNTYHKRNKSSQRIIRK